MGLDLNSLITLPESGVAAFVNEADRRVFLFHSSFLLEAVCRHVKAIRFDTIGSVDLHNDRNKLSFTLLEEVSNPIALPVRLRYWRDQFVAKGYELYKPINGVKYRLRVDYTLESQVVVTAVSSRRVDKYIIGVFRNLGLAHQWINNTFKDRNYIVPEYAANALTEAWLNTHKHKKLGSK